MTHIVHDSAGKTTCDVAIAWARISVRCPFNHTFVVDSLETNIECPVEGCGWYLSVRAKINVSTIWFGTKSTALSFGEHNAPKGEIIGPDASETRPSIGERSRAEPHRECVDDGGTGLDSSP